ncbi:MAG: DUF4271 domain-containing protein [Cyclobacteriaceae bacterium]
MNHKYFFSILFTILLCATDLSAQTEEVQWYTYSKKYNTYIPVDVAKRKVSFFLDLSKKDLILKVVAPDNSALFLDDRLLADIKGEEPLIVDIDSLAKIYRPDSAFITVYHKKSLKGLSTTILSKNKVDGKILETTGRKSTAEKDFYIFATVLLLLTAGIIRLSASVQSVYLMSFRQVILPQVVDNPFYSNSFFSREVVSFYVALSMVSGLLGVYFSDNLGHLIPVPTTYTFSNLLLFWVFYSVGVYGLFWLKLVLYKFLTTVFNFRRYTLIQNYDFLRISIILSVISFAFLFIDLFFTNVSLSVLWLFSLLVLMVYLYTTFRKLNKLYSHTKLHLFSYLCVSEMVPWIFLSGILGE